MNKTVLKARHVRHEVGIVTGITGLKRRAPTGSCAMSASTARI